VDGGPLCSPRGGSVSDAYLKAFVLGIGLRFELKEKAFKEHICMLHCILP